MIAKTFTLLLVLGVAFAKNLTDVDPNTLSCDPAGEEFLLLPHFGDCGKFYMCAHGKEVEFSCAPGTIFDFPLQTCNFAWATKCWLRGPESEIEGSGSGEESGDFMWVNNDQPAAQPTGILAQLAGTVRATREAPAVEPVATQSHFTAKLNCNTARDASRMVPFNGDCQRYWRCADGVLTSAYCSDGLFFNEKTSQCDFEANVRCAVNQEDELKGEFILYK